MIPLYEQPHFTFRFADDRIIPRFHLEGIEACRMVMVFKFDPGTGERLGLLATATVGDGGWVDLIEPIIVMAGDTFIAVAEVILTRPIDAASCPQCQGKGEFTGPVENVICYCGGLGWLPPGAPILFK
jgi:hypothetical protein